MSCPTLDDVARPVFSKTARSCPGHREAGRDGLDRPALAVDGRRLADDLLKAAAEGAQAVEANVEADVRHAAVGRPQQEHRPLDPAALKVAVWSLAEGRAKGSDEVRLRDVGDLSEGGHVEGLGVGTVHGITGAQHPSIRLLRGAAHAGIPRMAASAAARSSHGCLPRPMRMLRSWPLPASRMVSPGPALRTACAMPWRRSSIRVYCSPSVHPTSSAPAAISLRMVIASSSRGSSLVKTA